MKDQYNASKAATIKLEVALKSKSVCLAKWYHSNIYFQTGETHSCYHPSPHAIDVKEIKKNPSALHNTSVKLDERKEMLNGKRPQGCQYCWNIENLGDDFISDRHLKTGSLYTAERENALIEFGEHPDVIPDYIEISFGNECNFRCGYCHPKASSRYYNEIKEHGPYKEVLNHRCDINWFQIYKEDNNPYLDAWWIWWGQIQDQLKILRITGGEPLIQKSTYRLLANLNENPKPNLELNINSNLGSAAGVVSRFCANVEALVTTKKIKQFKLFTSIDTWGPQAEYIRNGLDIELFEKNLKHVLDSTQSPITLMITFNIFSIPNFDLLLTKILEWRAQNSWYGHEQFHRIRFDISYLKEPLQYDIHILPKQEFLPRMESHLEFIRKNLNDEGKRSFTYLEYEGFRRIVEYMRSTPYSDSKILEGRKDFWNFFTEQDRRRGTDFGRAFPELKKFAKMCKVAAGHPRSKRLWAVNLKESFGNWVRRF